MPWQVHLYFSRWSQGFLGRNATWRVTTRRTCRQTGAERLPERRRECAAAVSMDDIGGSQPEFRDRESGCLGSFRQPLDAWHTMVCWYPRARRPRARVSSTSCPPRQVSSVSTWMIESGRRKTNVALSGGWPVASGHFPAAGSGFALLFRSGRRYEMIRSAPE